MTISVRRPDDPSAGGPICGCFVQLPPITVVDRRATTPTPRVRRAEGEEDEEAETLVSCWATFSWSGQVDRMLESNDTGRDNKFRDLGRSIFKPRIQEFQLRKYKGSGVIFLE